MYRRLLVGVGDDEPSRRRAASRSPTALSSSTGGEPLVPAAAKKPSSAGPLMSVRIVFGVYQDTHGSRTNVMGENRRPSSPTGSAAGASRGVSRPRPGCSSFFRVRASASACLPFRWFSPRQRERDAAVALAAVDLRAHAAGLHVDAAERIDELREVREVDLEQI